MKTVRQRKTGRRATPRVERRTSAPASRIPHAPIELRGFITLPENTSAVHAITSVLQAVLLGQRARCVPLLLHGLPGTGKTRLTGAALGAIAIESRTATGRTVPARELAQSDRAELAECDFLVIEDIQHLPKSASDTLCELIDRRASRRMATVITSAAGPAQLAHLSRRLTSRLAAGLVVQLEPLGRESRRAIIEANARNLPLTADALDWLASRGDGLRTALGMVQNLSLAAREHSGPLDRAAVMRILAESGQPSSNGLELPTILKRVCDTFGVTQSELLGTSRLRRVLVPRQIAMYLARSSGKMSLPRIASAFQRDHSTVMHACRKVEDLVEADAKLAATVRLLRKGLS
jgi:chromosomal replication initiator protein